MSCCFQSPRQLCWCFRPPVLRFLVIFFSSHRPTHPTYSTLNEHIVLFFFVGKINWNCTKTLNISFGGSRTRIKKMKNAMIYWPQGQWGGVRARYCAPVHSYAVKRSRNTKWKMTVDRLFTSRHQASFKMGLIASPCSWSWFKVLTLISWFPACCQDMFQKGLSKGTESVV